MGFCSPSKVPLTAKCQYIEGLRVKTHLFQRVAHRLHLVKPRSRYWNNEDTNILTFTGISNAPELAKV